MILFNLHIIHSEIAFMFVMYEVLTKYKNDDIIIKPSDEKRKNLEKIRFWTLGNSFQKFF